MEQFVPTHARVIQLGSVQTQELLSITELEPSNEAFFIGKRINRNGSLTEYPRVTWWWQSVEQVPATIPHLFEYLHEARTRNICLIRGAPANPDRQPTRRLKVGVAGGNDRRDHGFVDEPTRLFFLDVDGMQIDWRADPERAIRTIVEQLGEPWASTSFAWFFSAKHGLDIAERDECKYWTGKIIDGKLYARIAFITERALNEAEASALTTIAKACVPRLDASIVRLVQPNYIRRPHWTLHPDRDVLGDTPTIGWIRGTHDYLAVPEELAHTARWSKAQGHSGDIADHPDAESAVRAIGSDGRVRQHLKSAVAHLLRANPIPEVTSFADYALNIAARLREKVEQHSGEITSNITAYGRHWSEIEQHLSQMPEWAEWCLNHPGVLRAGTIKLTRQEDAEKLDEAATREEIFARVARTIEFARLQALANDGLKEQRENLKKQLAELKADLKKSPAGREPTGPLTFAGQKRQHDDKGQDLERQLGDLTDQLTRLAYPPVTLLVAPTGSRKSTLMRAAAVQYVTERPEKTVVILMPRHKLGDEQVEMLRREHPDGNYSAAVWRGRHAWDPHVGNGHEQQMCRREVDAALVEEAVLDVEGSLCKQGRGKKAIKCPFYVDCAFQGQKQIKANIWFAAHECAVYEMPKAFGDVGWVIFDESPLDAFMSGVDLNDQVTLELDTLSTPLPVDQKPFGGNYNKLMLGRKVLYHALAKLPVPIESHLGAPALRMNLDQFIKPPGGGNGLYASEMHGLTWRGKVEPDIRPDLTGEQLKARLQEAAGNSTIKKEVWLWELVGRVADNKVNAGTKKQIAPGVTVTWRSGRRVTPEEFIQRIKAMNPSYGCIQTHRGKEGRIIRMVGMKPFTEGWDMPTLICDATGDAELLRPIWLQLAESEPHGWEQLPRPDNVQIFQCVNRPISKGAVGVEGKDEKDQKADSARRLYAAVLRKALEYGGQDIGVIVYKSTKDWILKNCFVPDWIKLLHWGDLTGTNALQKVRALFVIGRPLGAGETVTRQAEALFSDYIADRGYRKQLKGGRIPIVPDAAGNNVILVDVWEHPDPRAERLRRQITEGSLIQAVGRARAGLRKQDELLDIHLWTDVPLPELGPVEPMLWAELDAGLDGLMLAKEGVWLRNIADAAQGFNGLIPAAGLKKARAAVRGLATFSIGISIEKVTTPLVQTGNTGKNAAVRVFYRRDSPGCKMAEAVFLRGVADPRGWLEARLGPLAHFDRLG